MGMIIRTNLSALNTWNQLSNNSSAMNKSLAKLSSGYKINSSSDDASGLAISEKMLNQINGLNQASSNAQSASSMVQTADGALQETDSILKRIRELAVQSASDTNTNSDRSNIQDEVNALVTEINNIADTTEFNTKKLLNGDMSAATTLTGNVESNTSLMAGAGTVATGATALTALTDTAGNSLGIASGNTITLSYMKNGSLVSTAYTVTAGSTVADLKTSDYTMSVVGAASGTSTLATGTAQATATAKGTANAIYGLTFTVKSGTTENTSATDALSAFSQTTAATNLANDGSSTVLIGANTGQDINIAINNMNASSLGVQGIQVSTQAEANIAIKTVDTAIATVSAERGKLGAIVNRLDAATTNLSTASENLTSANSLIKDTDMASEMANYTKLSVLTQAATAMLAQANSQPQQVLKLLQ